MAHQSEGGLIQLAEDLKRKKGQLCTELERIFCLMAFQIAHCSSCFYSSFHPLDLNWGIISADFGLTSLHNDMSQYSIINPFIYIIYIYTYIYDIQGLPGKSPTIVNIMRMVCATSM